MILSLRLSRLDAGNHPGTFCATCRVQHVNDCEVVDIRGDEGSAVGLPAADLLPINNKNIAVGGDEDFLITIASMAMRIHSSHTARAASKASDRVE